ncbi:uncharacterized protein YaaN involved in tellurite resistance [Pseudochelatococcus lubricantis]|uniref:Uncharacterized protein YaaN involved in tellurite resistance n=1 Tax=Pseudochelatococcus lubricantis TaxID=1538102 RepID=A0ABX0V0N2_9HYPH|nr:toxic anion resistance protein [Pseudochelatococcus lubricantis]NIJ57654.1 uncharacterized protein YaaN involved in tellurite resistance [Pseudochelatococcus lubricantis]
MSLSSSSQTRTEGLPVLATDPAEVARIAASIDIGDRAAVATYGDGAQRDVTRYVDNILSQIQSKDIGEAGTLLSEILLKSKDLDPSSINQRGFLSRLFSSAEREIEKFSIRFQDVASQIDRIGLQLDKHKDVLTQDIALFDDLYERTLTSLRGLEAHIEAGKSFAESYRASTLPGLQQEATDSGDAIAAQRYRDALQALDRLEKRVYYLQQARQIALQQLPQIRIIQSGDQTLIENLQATTTLTVPAWKQKMVILLGLHRQRKALELQEAVTDATNTMIQQAAEMMKDQAIAIEKQSQKGIVSIDALQKANQDLVDTIQSVIRIQQDGRQQRAEAEKQLEHMTDDLKKALTSA